MDDDASMHEAGEEETQLREKLLRKKAELQQQQVHKDKQMDVDDKFDKKRTPIVWDEEDEHESSGVVPPSQARPKALHDPFKVRAISKRSDEPSVAKEPDRTSAGWAKWKRDAADSVRPSGRTVALVHASPTPVKDVRRNDDSSEKSRRERSSRRPDERSRERHTSGTDRHSKKRTHSESDRKHRHRSRDDKDRDRRSRNSDEKRKLTVVKSNAQERKVVEVAEMVEIVQNVLPDDRESGEASDSDQAQMEASGSHAQTHEVKEVVVKPKRAKFSKFESSESESEPEQTSQPVHRSSSESDNERNMDAKDADTPQTPEVEATASSAAPVQEPEEDNEISRLPIYYPGISGCRSVEEFQCINKIEEGTYGVVYRGKEKRTDEVVALKRLKMEKEKEGFPITSLREINMLLKAGDHENVVRVREIVVGSNMDKIYLVMDYVEHDMKSLMESLREPFLTGQVKTLLHQLLSGVHHLHDNWILHRDLKTSNLLLSHRGILKIGDFGLAREYDSPLKPYTPIVVTLWYRAPELLLGVKEYSTPIDMWSVGCIMAEFLTLKPIFPGKGELDAINKIFKMLGTPNTDIWPGYDELSLVRKSTFAVHAYNQLRKHFGPRLNDTGFNLLNRFLTYNPARRISAAEALRHEWFTEKPLPVHPDMFPTWPAKSEGRRMPNVQGRKQPAAEEMLPPPDLDEHSASLFAELKVKPSLAPQAFSIKFDAPKF